MVQKSNSKDNIMPPDTRKQPVTDTIFGIQITDEYRWLENKEDPEVIEWSHRQHDYTINYLKTKTEEVAGLREEIRSYLDRDYIGAPFFKGNREFFFARKKGEQQNKIYTRVDGKEILIFDPMSLDSSGKASITAFVTNSNGSKAAVGIQYKGDEISEFRIIDTKTGEQIGNIISGLSSFSWTKDELHAYITVRTREMIDSQVPLRTYLHKIGDDRKNDIFLVAPEDARDYASVADAEEGDVTIFMSGDFYSTTLKIRKAGSSDEPVQIYSSDKYTAYPHVKGDKMYILTNHESPNYKLMVADLKNPAFEKWKVFCPEQKTVLESFVVTNDFVIIQDKKDVLSRLTAYDLNGKKVKELKLPEVADVGGMNYHKESNNIYISLQTFQSPAKIYKLDGKTLEWTFFYQDTPPIDTKNIETHLVFYNSKDGARIPLFIVNKKGIKPDGTNPTLLYGYGGFNVGMSPSYLGTAASFINRGGIYAIACLRGGNEYGENWHRDGMLYKKQNTFDDFIAAAEYLIKQKYTSTQNLAIKGGSNGGLLIGAVLTQRPDLFKAAICAVPLLDMLRYHKFLIARYWIPEYGDPDKEEDFKYILNYSPYHNIKKINYPATLIKAGENDSRVDPLHAKKFAAALMNNPAQENPVLLFVDFDSGHGSGQSIDQMVENIELEWRFLMNELGMTEYK